MCGEKIIRHHSVKCILYSGLSLPTDTAFHLSQGEDGLLRGEIVQDS